MQVTQTSAEGLKREFKVVMDAAEIEGKLVERLAGMQQTVQLPGFRPGKVPVTLLRQRFGKSVLGEVVQEALNSGASEAITDGDLRPAMQPKVEVTSFDEGADLEYTIALEVLPVIEPGDLSTLELERLNAEVGDDALEEQLGRLAEQQRRFTAAGDGHESETGDALRVDFAGTVDGVAFDGGTGEDMTVVLGDSDLVPGFAEQLVGVKAGDHVRVEVTFPEKYHEALASKDAVFEVDVREIRRPETVTVDDELATQLGLESLDDLRGAIREQLGKEYAGLARARLKRRLLDALAERYDFELPPGLVEQEFETIWQQVEHDREHGHPDPDLEGRTDDDLKTEFRSIAERRVRLGLLLAEIGQRNNIEVQQDELNRAIAERARQLPGEQQQRAFEYFRSNPSAAAQLQAPIFEDKVVDFIFEMATISDRSVPLDELLNDPDDAVAGADGEGEGKTATPVAGKKKAASNKPAAKRPAAKKPATKKAATKTARAPRKTKKSEEADPPADEGEAQDTSASSIPPDRNHPHG